MIKSEILEEKYRVQSKLSKECGPVHEYLEQSKLAAEKAASVYGFDLHYVQLPNNTPHTSKGSASSHPHP